MLDFVYVFESADGEVVERGIGGVVECALRKVRIVVGIRFDGAAGVQERRGIAGRGVIVAGVCGQRAVLQQALHADGGVD